MMLKSNSRSMGAPSHHVGTGPRSYTSSRNNKKNVSTRASFGTIFTPISSNKLSRLLRTVESTDRGTTTTKTQLDEIKQYFNELENLNRIGTKSNINGTWKLVWTTEKETLFILQNAKIFGTQAGEVYQVIDWSQGILQNVIEFPPEGAFIVNSSLEWVGGDAARTKFKFNKATLNLPGGKRVGLPPFGQGWFESIYCDGRYRLAKDIRGDYLVTIKDGVPRKFE